MRLQTVLPAILFAHKSKFGINKASGIVASGSDQGWTPVSFIDCSIAIYKHGTSCATWTTKIILGYDLFQPLDYIKAVDGKECQV
ncbi:hypothetical protein BLS_010032 [Venturia inaequalis]|uniref:Uncharacterized protein n=1 Tax=Venturia inaequalis TaxID=5025 RepID=A0A8H3UZ53_VENIN|nr:hypothetical protein BLS_010032 [Venturia inaequalis]